MLQEARVAQHSILRTPVPTLDLDIGHSHGLGVLHSTGTPEKIKASGVGAAGMLGIRRPTYVLRRFGLGCRGVVV